MTSGPLSIDPPRRLLFGPGPSQLHPRVYAAMSQPLVSHLDPYFFQVSEEIQRMLRAVFQTKNELVFAISATGSGGMETAISNFVEPGAKVAVLANGFFSDRIGDMATRQHGHVVRLEKAWGEICAPEEAAAFIRQERPQVVTFVHAETSTGALQPGQAILIG